MAKPRLLDAVMTERILTLARAGNFRTTIAKAVGITRESLYAWCKQYPEFAEKLSEAEATAEHTAVGKMLASSDPRWALAWLERRHPTRWSQTALAKPELEDAETDAPESEAVEELVNQRVAERLRELGAKGGVN